MQNSSIDPRYPIGKFQPKPYSEEQKKQWLNDIKYLPSLLENTILNLDEAQLDTPYREGGWTVKQVVHHVADSHINAYCRFKLGLTEPSPVTIRPYDEKAWAELNDVKNIPVNVSITLLHALHIRLHEMIKDLSEDQFNRILFHPERKTEMTIWDLLGMYSWHGLHHVSHISTLRENMDWDF